MNKKEKIKISALVSFRRKDNILPALLQVCNEGDLASNEIINYFSCSDEIFEEISNELFRQAYEIIAPAVKKFSEIQKKTRDLITIATDFSEEKWAKKLNYSYYLILRYWQALQMPKNPTENSNEPQVHRQYLDSENDLRSLPFRIWNLDFERIKN